MECHKNIMFIALQFVTSYFYYWNGRCFLVELKWLWPWCSLFVFNIPTVTQMLAFLTSRVNISGGYIMEHLNTDDGVLCYKHCYDLVFFLSSF